jgi:hypothetical protein
MYINVLTLLYFADGHLFQMAAVELTVVSTADGLQWSLSVAHRDPFCLMLKALGRCFSLFQEDSSRWDWIEFHVLSV